MQHSRGRRRGVNFTVRLTDDERASIEAARAGTAGPRGMGPWLVWHALSAASAGEALPDQVPAAGGGTASAPRQCRRGGGTAWTAFRAPAVPGPGPGTAQPIATRLILDLCAGSGAWSEPYRSAGYPCVRVDLKKQSTSVSAADVRSYVPPAGVWGVLAAPPCQQFSIARNGLERDFVQGMECVNACLRIIFQCRPRWWALENPASGLLPQFLGPPRDSWQPFEFGDAWSKATALWGEFALPARGPIVHPLGSAMDRSSAAARAVTPPGFASAFFAANP